MARDIKNSLTTKGAALIARSLGSGSAIVFIRAELGTGLDSDPLPGKTRLIAYFADADIQRKTADESGNFIITVSFENSAVTVPRIITEVGVFARLESETDDKAVLFSYLTFGSEANGVHILPAETQGMQNVFDLPFAFGSGDSVGVNITPSGMVSADDVVLSAAPGKIVMVGPDGKLDTDITGDASSLGGHDPDFYATADHTHDVATQSKKGFMAANDKKTLDDLKAKVDQSLTTTSAPTFAGLTVNGVISGARFV